MQKDLEKKKIILASKSPRRHALIKKLNIDFDVLLPTYKEKLDSDIYNDKKIASLSLNKALSVLDTLNTNKTDNKSLKNTLIVSADTVVVLENKILGKPKNETHAAEMLHRLSGKKHFVVTALTVIDTYTQKTYADIVKTFVTFQKLSDELIEEYIKTKKPLDKAGAYGIQEMNSTYIANVEGDLENVIGLPTKALKDLLIKAGYCFDNISN